MTTTTELDLKITVRCISGGITANDVVRRMIAEQDDDRANKLILTNSFQDYVMDVTKIEREDGADFAVEEDFANFLAAGNFGSMSPAFKIDLLKAFLAGRSTA